jgi:hypothetical protein
METKLVLILDAMSSGKQIDFTEVELEEDENDVTEAVEEQCDIRSWDSWQIVHPNKEKMKEMMKNGSN